MFTTLIIGLVTVVALVAAYLLTPTPSQENAKANNLDDFTVTTNANSRVVPIVFGTTKVAPNVLWYGDLRSSAIWS